MTERKELVLRTLKESDISKIVNTFTFPWTSLETTKEKWECYYREQSKNDRIVYIALLQDSYVGYGSLLKASKYPAFKKSKIPEINDIWILTEYRGKGFGRKLIQQLEIVAYENNYKQIGIGVGLYKDYGKAQQLYIQMGYVPDGMGVTYNYQPVIPGESYPLDDELILWLKKDLP